MANTILALIKGHKKRQWLWLRNQGRRSLITAQVFLIATITLIPLPHAAAGELNPTGRDITLSMPIIADDASLGDLLMQLGADDQISLEANRLIQMLEPFVTPEHLAELKNLVTAELFISKHTLESLGYEVKYDPARLQLNIAWPANVRALTRLGSRREISRRNPLARFPEATSAYLNLYGGTTHRDGGNIEETSQSLSLDAAISLPAIRHTTLEAEGQLTEENEIARDGTRLVFDQVGKNRRWRLGDIDSIAHSFLGSREVLGISLDQNLNTFQRGQRLGRPTGRTSFFLERESVVRIFVNGALKSTRRLKPGPYELDEFPITAGANRIVVEIEDDTGIRDRLSFNLFSDNEFLRKGIREYSVTLGTERSTVENEIDYSSDTILSGLYRFGFTDTLTPSAFVSISEDLTLAGATALVAVPHGKLNVEAATSKNSDNSELEQAVNASWSHYFPAADRSRGKRLLVATEYTSEFFNQASNELGNKRKTSSNIDYRERLNHRWGWGIAARHSTNWDETDSQDFGLRLDYRLPKMNWSLEIDHEIDEGVADTIAMVRYRYRLNRQSRLSASADTDEDLDLSYSFTSKTRGVGAWGFGLDASTNASDDESLGMSAHYDANRARLRASHRVDLPSGSGETANYSTVNVSSAIAYVGGKLAIGRPIYDSFAIFTTHKNLRNRSALIVPDKQGGYRAKSGWLGPALYHQMQSYRSTVVGYDVDDLPLGYNLGDSLAQFYPTYRSGFHERIGSSATVTAIGMLTLDDGTPAKLLTGRISPIKAETDDSQVVFTNSAGRFSTQGVSPGSWLIELNGPKGNLEYQLDVPDGTEGLLRAGKLSPSGNESQDK